MVSRAYRDYIKSERWKRKRQQVFAHYGKRCFACGKRAKVLHVHHRSYKHLGNERINELLPLCIPCHKYITNLHRKNRRGGLWSNTNLGIKLIRKGLRSRQ